MLTTASGEQRLPTEHVKVVEWILARDYFDADDLARAFNSMKAVELSTLTAMLIAVGLIERL